MQEIFKRAPTNARIDLILDELFSDDADGQSTFMKVLSQRLKHTVEGLQQVNQVGRECV
jgi:hypothetical protein